MIGFLLGLLFSTICAKGSIFFPLSSVNVTLPHTTIIPSPLPPLVELALLSDVPDYLTEKTGPNVARFELVNDKYDGLFFVQRNELCVHSRFFTDSFSLPRDTEHYSLNIAGYLDNEGPAYMWVNVILSQKELTCALHKYELCFWGSDTFQVTEGLENVVLGTLSSPLISALCPEFTVTYDLNKGHSSKWLAVQRHGNGLGGWVAAVSERLDREKSSLVSAKVNCTVEGGGDPPVLYINEINLQIRNIDDSTPVIQFQTSTLVEKRISKDEKLAFGRIDDPDGINLSHYDFKIESSDWPMSISCGFKSNTSTFVTCGVYSETDGDFTKTIHFTVVVTDQTLVPGYGVKTIKKEYFLPFVEQPTPRVESLISHKPSYPTEIILLPANAQNWSRVAQPSNTLSSVHKFYLTDNRFSITEKAGIVYVKNSGRWTLNELITLKIGVKTFHQPDTFYNILIKVIAPVFAAKPCRGKISRLEKNEGNVEWCAELSNAKDCLDFCGNGIRQPSGHGGCYWRHFLQGARRNYSSCTVDPETCPDDKCDALEEIFPGICPQDCTKIVKGTGSKELNGTGIFRGEGICHWDHIGDWCQCSSDYNASFDDILPRELAPICDPTCQATLGVSALLLMVVISIIIIFYIRKYRRMKKRCVTLPVKEELSTMNYEEYVRRPLREPEPPVRPDYFDPKWEFPRHRLTIDETIGEGEFGMVLKARADGIQNFDGTMIVAVKTLKNAAKDSELGDLVSELELLKDVDHPNVIKLLGACTTAGGPLYVIIEFAEFGSLRSYLRRHRPSTIEGEKEESCYLEGVSPLTSRHILTFAWHIAKGMSYLTEMKLVHRDLAARNVLLTKDLVCKISDFGLTRDIYEDDTYLKRSKGRVPIKWMALESLADHVYTSKSDVWSYGVLLWELVTRGTSPYPGVTAQNIFNLLNDGYRMERPQGCSMELYALMRACWARSSQHRPSFASLVTQLDFMLAAGREYLDLCPGAVENRQYMDNAPQWIFHGYDRPRPCSCPPSQCSHMNPAHYENEPLGDNFNTNDEKTDTSIIEKV